MHEASGSHWLDHTGERLEEVRTEGPALIEFCERFDAIALWADPDPNSQLTLIWLLDYLRRHAVAPLTLVQADASIGDYMPEDVAGWRLPSIKIQDEHLEAASRAWQAYRQPMPQDCFNLLGEDLSLLPQLRTSVLELLEELPMLDTGLGATEMRMLELISKGDASPFDVFPGDKKPNKRRVFDYWEVGELLDALACHPAPAVSGLKGGRSRRRCTTTDIVMRDTNRASSSSRRSAKPFCRGPGILPGTTRSTAGGARPN